MKNTRLAAWLLAGSEGGGFYVQYLFSNNAIQLRWVYVYSTQNNTRLAAWLLAGSEGGGFYVRYLFSNNAILLRWV